MTEKRAGWASNLGFILAAAGSAIGLGNLWKFPGKVGQYGGGTFIVVYLCMVLFIGFSCMLAEITLGRHTQKNAVGAFAHINKRWSFAGKLGILTAFIILSYYSVVGGWVLKYVFTYLTGANFGGAFGATGKVNETLLAELQGESYYRAPLPKTTGRELFGAQYVANIMQRAAQLQIADADLVATVTDLTAWSIADAYEQYVLPRHTASELVVGGGGSYNKTLLACLSKRFAAHGIAVKTQEDLGLSSDAKEAVAFAILADCCYHGIPNNLPSVTGAQKPVIMGKLSKA